MKTLYVCGNCRAKVGRRDVEAGGICPRCLASDIRVEKEEDPAPRRGSTAVITHLDEVEPLQLIPCAAPLVAGLGGVESTAIIVVSGVPGEGKSTECARVAVDLGEPPAYLDAEMSAARCKVVLEDAGATTAFIRKTCRITGEDWRDAFDAAASRSVWIIDSATEWAGQKEEKEFTDALVRAAAEERIILVIQQWSTKGRPRGTLSVEHRGDVTIDVHSDHFDVRKARWGEKGRKDRPRIITARMMGRSAPAKSNRPRR